MGGFLSYFRPLRLRGLFAFPMLRFYGTFCQNYFPKSSLPTSPIFGKKTPFLRKRQRWADFSQTSAPYNYEAFSRFQFYVITLSFGKNYFPNYHRRRVPFLKTPFLRKRQRWADFSQIFARYNYEGFFALPILRLYGTFATTIFPNHHFRWVTS